jgi:bacillithiol biosynthesis deacetylase BshB1
MVEKLDILAFAAHPDDVEISCAGTLIKHIALGLKVGIIDLTQGDLGTRGSIETRNKEAKKATDILGLNVRENLKMIDGFFEHNEENKIKIIQMIRKYRPDIVLANAIDDRHPDHGRGAKLVSDACFYAGLRKIETSIDGVRQDAYRPKTVFHYIQDRYIKPDFVVDVTEYIDRKLEAIKAYKSQFYDPNSKEPQTPISGEEFFEFILGGMMQFGRPIGVRYAEGFTVERVPGVRDLTDLI